MSPAFTRLAILNRGEAALRCLRTVKALRAREGSDLRAVAFHTDVDRDAPYVRRADAAVRLPAEGGDRAAWLDHAALLAALREARADAVWPGWGFVAENADFVAKVEAAGMVFLGPGAAAMRALGDKVRAKEIAEAAGVPVVAWSGGVLADEAAARAAAGRLGFPLALKAAAGGGGRGIRMLERPEELADAWRAASAEAASAFGDARVFLEQRIEGGRRVEVQIAADHDGHVRSLGCRDCSVQRRHQKVIEEAPPPGLGGDLRRGLEDAAVRLARTAGYVGLGTVEFLVSGDGFHFLEMNPRLQVEHGVTEALTGLDLVELQIRIARGESLAGLVVREDGAAMEARVCAEDPEQGFLPAPGRVVRFEPALGPRVRVDTGVAAGSAVPAAFDSLVAKVIASGADREEARARLVAALADTDLVIAGGASNKGWLGDVLAHPDFRSGAVDVRWLDRLGPARPDPARAPLALAAAAILRYQRDRTALRLNFFSDPSAVAGARRPASTGQEIDLVHAGVQYRMHVLAVGSWRYHVREGGRTLTARLREEGPNAAHLEVGAESHRLLHDLDDAEARVEVDGRPFRLGFQTAGQVRAGAPAVVVAVHVAPGDRVEAGQRIGLLEAMKMEVGFEAPVAGVVAEVRAQRGQQVAAGDVLLVIDPSGEAPAQGRRGRRLVLPEEPDPLRALFADDALERPDLAAAAGLCEEDRRAAVAAAREEVRRVLLGYDAHPERADRLARFLEADLPAALGEGLRWDLAAVRHELGLFADVASLFSRWHGGPPGAEGGVGGEREGGSGARAREGGNGSAGHDGRGAPSNEARLRMYVRRVRAGGAGIAEPFLERVRGALRHYGVDSLEPGDALERAVLRLLASQSEPERRDRLVLALLRRTTALARAGVHLADDAATRSALDRIASLRGLVGHAVADAAIEARYVIFERPRIEQQAERTSKEVEAWTLAAQSAPTAPPDAVLRQLAEAPPGVFERVGRWLGDPGAGRRAIALAAHARRLYAPQVPLSQASSREDGEWILRLELPGPRVVLAASCGEAEVVPAVERLARAAERERGSHEWPAVHALELFVAGSLPADPAPAIVAALGDQLPCGRLTLSRVDPDGAVLHRSFAPTATGYAEETGLHGVHPAAAARIDLARLAEFDLERLPAPRDVYCFAARSHAEPSDERIFVLAEVRARSPEDGREAELHASAFEHVFHEAARSLRLHLGLRDPQRRLQWNRIAIHVATPLFLDGPLVSRLAERLAPATRNLGLEKVVVRLALLDREHPDRPPRDAEVVISDVTGQHMTARWRAPRRARLQPASPYERRVAEARRRRLVYPYEIVRMLTEAPEGASHTAAGLPVGCFREYDLVPAVAEGAAGAEKAVPVERPPGGNLCGVVFGLITTPTARVPEGMERVLVLSDPTRSMGSLAGPECARLVAALDLAAERGVPLEWVAVSSGARIAMDSGTENLDATGRVVRRLVGFTREGGVAHVIVPGVNVGAQSYFDALATMGTHTRGCLILTDGGSLVLTGRAALRASGSVSAEDESAIGGFERIMGPNGEAHHHASDLAEAYRILYEHYRYSYVVPGEAGPRRGASADPPGRSVADHPVADPASGFATVGEIFDDATNPGRKRPFPMRAVMEAVVDRDGGHLERWGAWVGAETAIVWDACLGGEPVCLIGIESRPVERQGYRPADGPDAWTGGTLFPLSSKKVARAIHAASGNRPVVVLANLSGFDGSPESMRKLQLEHGAEIARAVVGFEGPIVFLVVSRYHGGAYVVFSRSLHPRLRAAALRGSYASVIGGSAAAAVVFPREARARAAADPRVRALREALRRQPDAALRARLDRVAAEVEREKQAELAAAFDAVHTVERAREVGSLEEIVEPDAMRAWLIRCLREEGRAAD